MKLSVIFHAANIITSTAIMAAAILAAHSGVAAGHRSKQLPPAQPVLARPVTFTRDIAPILFQHCASCHHSGDIGPFDLLHYEDARKRAHQIVAVTENRYMPPWHADSHGEFVGERRLTTLQIATLKKWVASGTPEGSLSDLPPQPTYAGEWKLGTPDTVLSMNKAYTLDPEGPDVYRCFVLSTHFSEDRYLAAMEFKPGNRSIIHHMVACLDTSGKARSLEHASDGVGYTPHGDDINPTGGIGIWTPGSMPSRLPAGVGTLLPKGADIVLQVHYSKTGKSESDLTKIGLYFCTEPVDKRARLVVLFQPYLDIAPGDANYTLHSFPMPTTDDVTILQVMPHMHNLGRSMTVSAKLPDQTHKVLISVSDWDFRWQTAYTYREPVKLPKNSVVTMMARYDNSTQNPRNPFNPPRRVTWGSLSTDEMCIAGLIYTSDSEHLTKGKVSTGFYGFGRF